MNVTPYFFGEFNNRYTQYPDDYANTIFKNFYNNSKSVTQIAIHREGDLMYYGYIRKLEQEKYIGFCVVINGLMLTKLDGLFLLYENAISNLVINGQLIHFNEQGNIVTNVDRLYMNREELDLLTQSFRAGFSHLKESLQPLPAVSYGVSKDSIKNFSIENDIVEIIKSSHTYGYTYVYKSKDFEPTQLNSYKGILNRLNKEKTELVEKYEELTLEHYKTIKQKKQYKVIIILGFIILVCFIVLLSFNNNLEIKDNQINNLKKEHTLEQIEIQNLNADNSQLLTDKRKLEKENFTLSNDITRISNRNVELTDSIDQLDSEIRELSSDVEYYKKYAPKRCKVLVKDNYYFKNRCGKLFEETSCYSNPGNYVNVFKIDDGYGLTEDGWMRMAYLYEY